MAVLSRPATDLLESDSSGPEKPGRRKAGNSLRGLKLGIRGHSSFFVHFFFAALVMVAAGVLRCELWEWCILIFSLGMLMTAELFKSAFEILFFGLDEAAKERSARAMDVAAGAALLATITAALLGTIVFVHRLGEILLTAF